MKNHSAFALLLATAALASCETTVDLPEPPHTPRAALMYTLSTAPQDSSFRELFYSRQLYVSNSKHVFSKDDLPGRTDATVELRNAAGTVVERYRPVGTAQYGYPAVTGYYRPVVGFRPQPGQSYTLRATLPGLETAESTLTVPQTPVIKSATYAPSAPNANLFEHRGRLSVVVRDDPSAANYYLAFARVLDQQGQPGDWSPLEVDYNSQSNTVSIDQFGLSSPQQRYSLYPFADANVNGQRISLVSDARFFYNCYQSNCTQQPGYIEVHVSSITKEACDFYLSRRRYLDSDGNPFAEPAPLASNVRGGYGLFAGAADATYRIRIF